MDAEHRHELKTNDLAKWINNFPQWVKNNKGTLVYVAIVLVLVAGSFFYYHRTVETVSQNKLDFTKVATALPQTKTRIVQARMQNMDLGHTLLTVADSLADAATKSDTPDMQAMAYLKRGDSYRMELHYRTDNVTQQDVEFAIEQAKQSYNNAITAEPSNTLLKAMATLGLGLCEEEVGNFDGAKEIYKKIIDTPQFEGNTASAIAQTRLQNMDDFKQRLTFKPAPVKVDPNATPTPITLDINDVNLPVADANQEPNK